MTDKLLERPDYPKKELSPSDEAIIVAVDISILSMATVYAPMDPDM